MAEQTFAEYTAHERDEFSRFINHKKWDNELRTKCEDLLIAYDQMKAKCDLEEQLETKEAALSQRIRSSLIAFNESSATTYHWYMPLDEKAIDDYLRNL